MNKTFPVAKCPCCTMPIPLNAEGFWIRHDCIVRQSAMYECPGSGEAPHKDCIHQVECSDEPKSPEGS